MMRPIKKLQSDSDVEIAQYNNLRSACALAAILTKNNESELEFYREIVTISHYQSVNFLQLLEKEDSK